MKLEQQVTSLELSKKLKELGLPQTAHFGHIAGCIMAFPETTLIDCSAFSVAELGEILPPYIFEAEHGHFHQLQSQKTEEGEWEVFYIYHWHETDHFIGEDVFQAETEADARAKMLIYLIENKLIKI